MKGERRKNEGEDRREENMIRRTKKNYLGTPKKKVGFASCNVCPSEPCVEIISKLVIRSTGA